MKNAKGLDKRGGSLKITTIKDETGSIRVIGVEPIRKKNIDYNEDENKLKGDVIKDETIH